MQIKPIAGTREAQEPRFAVLLATYNGELYLKEQLNTLREQSVSQLDVFASDDGSTDGTRNFLIEEAVRWEKGRFEIVDGPKDGFAENFRSLVLRADPGYDFYAFCDQDDLWDSDKLEYAASRLRSFPSSIPALYCGSTRTLLESRRLAGTSPIMRRDPSFRNALVQSIAGGNTMVMNLAAFNLLRKACQRVHFVSHDWWTYMIVAGAGGTVIYDPVPRVSYRQHGGNLVGSNTSLVAKFRRLKRLFRNEYRKWHDDNLKALCMKKELLTPENASILEALLSARSVGNGVALALVYRRLGLYRQSWSGNVMLFLGACLGKI